MTIDKLTRPYHGKGCHNIGDVKVNDRTSPPKLGVEIGAAFELLADGAIAIPPQQQGKDPVYIVLTNCEPGARFEFLSTSDHTDGEFDHQFAEHIFELPVIGRDFIGRRVAILLSQEQMDAKGIAAGEELLVRQVDESGKNASVPTELYLDPVNWQAQQYSETVNGQSQTVMGRAFDVFVGDHGLLKPLNPPETVSVLAKVTKDATQPGFKPENISISTVRASKTDLKAIQALSDVVHSLIGEVALSGVGASVDNLLAGGSLDASWKTKCELVQKAFKDPEFKDKLLAMVPNIDAAVRVQGLTNIIQNEGVAVTLHLNKAFEVGSSFTVTDRSGGETYNFSVTAENRAFKVPLLGACEGDLFSVSFNDKAGNTATHDFAYSPASPGGIGKPGRRKPIDVKDISFKPAAFSSEETEAMVHLANVVTTLVGEQPAAPALQSLQQNMGSWKGHSSYAHLAPSMDSAVQTLTDAAFLERITSVIPQYDGNLRGAQLLALAAGHVSANIAVALPAGSHVTVHNQSTNEQYVFSSTRAQRRMNLPIGSPAEGAPLLVKIQLPDGTGNDFLVRYVPNAESGRVKSDALSVRLPGFPLPRRP